MTCSCTELVQIKDFKQLSSSQQLDNCVNSNQPGSESFGILSDFTQKTTYVELISTRSNDGLTSECQLSSKYLFIGRITLDQ
mmetsp:Transcript_9800/g.16510  ORF Transcript_9800/g.16510 Transcript_9800/m.16510 type:complete len:82 (+) Transcript_9800:1623-1868(+)